MIWLTFQVAVAPGHQANISTFSFMFLTAQLPAVCSGDNMSMSYTDGLTAFGTMLTIALSPVFLPGSALSSRPHDLAYRSSELFEPFFVLLGSTSELTLISPCIPFDPPFRHARYSLRCSSRRSEMTRTSST